MMDQMLTIFADSGIPAEGNNFTEVYVMVTPLPKYPYCQPRLVILLDVSAESTHAMLNAIMHSIQCIARDTNYIFSIIKFNENVEMIVDTMEYNKVAFSACNDIYAHGQADFNTAIIFAIKHARQHHDAYKNTQIWVFSNGEQTVRQSKNKRSDIIDVLNQGMKDIPIHIFSISSAANASKLLQIALATGGQYEHLALTEDVFNVIAARVAATQSESAESFSLTIKAFPGARIVDVKGGVSHGYCKESTVLIGKLCPGQRKMFTIELSLRALTPAEPLNQHVISVAYKCNEVEIVKGDVYIMRGGDERQPEAIESMIKTLSDGWDTLYYAAELAQEDKFMDAIKLISDTIVSVEEFEEVEANVLFDSLRRLRLGFEKAAHFKRMLNISLLPRPMTTDEQIVLRRLTAGWPG